MVDPNEERRLFEQALADLDSASLAKLVRAKGGASSGLSSEQVARPRSRRLDKRRKTAEPDAVIDLHGLDRRAAIEQVREFIVAHRSSELLLVVHGKGRGILQQRISGFLSAQACVVEHVAAPQRLGGTGARLVRLRRNR